MSKLCFVAGDPSGDERAAALIAALARRDATVACAGLGGPRMQAAGMTLLDDLTQTASIGPFDALRHLRHFAQARSRFRAHLQATHPDAVILVDFGDFNLPVIAPLAKRSGCRVLYYVSPQLWAWGRFRLRWLRRYVDRMFVLFRFEEAFYRQRGIPVTWVGHPLVEATSGAALTRAEAQHRLGLNPWRMTVGLLPGSRAQEVRRHLPLLLSTAMRIAWSMPGAQFLVPKAPGLSPALFALPAHRRDLDVRVVEDRLWESLRAMDAAVVCSGTATLEAALCDVPMVVVYQTSWPTYLAAKALLRVPHIAIVNLIAGRRVVPEFVQAQARPREIAKAVVGVLQHEDRAEAMRAELRRVKDQLGSPGAVERAANAVLEELAR